MLVEERGRGIKSLSWRSATCKVQAQQTHRVSKTVYPNFKRNFKRNFKSITPKGCAASGFAR